jgi:NADH:ubiquinone oxidoreductase subunit K
MFELTLFTVLLWIIAIGVTIMLLPFIASLLIAVSIFAMGASVTAFVFFVLLLQTIAEKAYVGYKIIVSWFKRTSGTRPS